MGIFTAITFLFSLIGLDVMKIHCIVLYRNHAYRFILSYIITRFSSAVMRKTHLSQPSANGHTNTVFNSPFYPFPLISHLYKLVKFTPLSCLILSPLWAWSFPLEGWRNCNWSIHIIRNYSGRPLCFAAQAAIRKIPDSRTWCKLNPTSADSRIWCKLDPTSDEGFWYPDSCNRVIFQYGVA